MKEDSYPECHESTSLGMCEEGVSGIVSDLLSENETRVLSSAFLSLIRREQFPVRRSRTSCSSIRAVVALEKEQE